MNHSIYSADRATHLKIVVTALAAEIAVAGLGLYSDAQRAARIVRIGESMMMVSSDALTIGEKQKSGISAHEQSATEDQRDPETLNSLPRSADFIARRTMGPS